MPDSSRGEPHDWGTWTALSGQRADDRGVDGIQRRRTPASRALLARGGHSHRSDAPAGTPFLRAGTAAEPELDPVALVRGIEAALLRAGMAAYYAVIDGAVTLVRAPLPGRHVDARA